jgi:signal transduction histidine kinase
MNIFRFKPSLGIKLVCLNTLIMLVVALAGVGLVQHYDFLHGIVILGFSAMGFGISVLVSGLMVKSYIRPLLDFRNAMESLPEDAFPSIPTYSDPDPAIGGVISSVRQAISQIEDSSLRHTTQLLNSIEGERQRIGRELHDQTCQTLATALLDIKMVEITLNDGEATHVEGARSRLAAAKQLIEHSLEQIKICVYDLRPVMLDDFGLVPTMRWHIRTHLAESGIVVNADFEDASLRAPRNIETTLYRVAQEALANTLRHAQATRVYVKLETREGYAVLKISDNGKGFDLKRPNRGREDGGLGLRTMRERVKLVKGSLKIESELGMGTHLHVVVPIPSQEPFPATRIEVK